MRKGILKSNQAPSAPLPGELDVAAIATVLVTSGTADHPVENAFDARRGYREGMERMNKHMRKPFDYNRNPDIEFRTMSHLMKGAK